MEDDSPTEESQKKETEFKKPVLIGRIGKLPKKAKTDIVKPQEEKKDEKPKEPVEPATESNSKSTLPPAVLLKELSTPIPYKEPKWSGLCPDGSNYALEVIKSGMIVERIDLCSKPYYVFGRLANCDIVMAHPTISRHHAVLQYKAFATEGEPPAGWYAYELGSTHGSQLNRARLKPAHYARVRVGHQLKFGASSRTYILLGPDFDCEGESELTVTEIKQRALDMKLNRDKMIQEALEQREKDRLEAERKREEQGIDWGMGEDAEEEPDLSENPYASTANEELYLEDPKKTLRGYFEREGHELSYDCEERAPGQHICRVELPIDDARGRPVVAEVMHRGKKKEAVVACALEACRLLDRAGLLRQATHESRRRKERDWGADDYYDSDDDPFLDRTGSVERKRTQRMRRQHKDPQSDQPLTYEDLLKQVTEIEAKIATEEKSLERLRQTNKPQQQEEGEADALDEYMTSLGKQGQSMAQKAEISKTKMSIQKLKTELARTRRLADVARPAHAPPLIKKDDKHLKVANSVVYGKRIRLKEDMEKRPKVKKEVKQEEGEFVEEMDSDEEMPESTQSLQESSQSAQESSQSTQSAQESTQSTQESTQSTQSAKESTISTEVNSKDIKSEKTVSSNTKSEKEVKSEPKRVFGPMRPPENYVIPETYFDAESDRDLPEIMEKE